MKLTKLSEKYFSGIQCFITVFHSFDLLSYLLILYQNIVENIFSIIWKPIPVNPMYNVLVVMRSKMDVFILGMPSNTLM